MPATSPLCHRGVLGWRHRHGRLVALLSRLFTDFLLHVIVELQLYCGGVSSVQGLRYVGSSSTSSPLCCAVAASRGCLQHPWAVERPWARSASHTTQCCPAPVAILGSLQWIETAPRGEVLYCIYFCQEAAYWKPGLAQRSALRTRPPLLLGSWRQGPYPKPKMTRSSCFEVWFYLILWQYGLILWLYGLILCWILFGDSLCASNTNSIWYLVSRGEPKCHWWRKIETDGSCNRWSGGSGASFDPMYKREILERDLSWFRTSCRSEITQVGLRLDIQKRVACPHEAVDGTVCAIVVQFELKEERIVTPAI
jgi:hypothetical protein